ncbi:retinoid-inducible serine carboxypeptidase-like isoform X2 [Leptopilina heterotoma]|nr:retinoid-inducible serine carboxypeptidase-like isoform X2 [Leptopilina heterotoma]XP_043478976.1 retinoid-inducible serine carboxypeptidase-like isoform X2 [Leptopilina heterotoma]XP_043478977.1 retinoid-inducible serine carboxypeptidase-like isoform X2 [Leptopilina heterotoma]XP_043478978.1 retinoid-inducible serine carboxypeptidase-like isoform X2 [Leptopilina heterotoma]
MYVKSIILLCLLGFCQLSHAKYGFRGEQEWGFVTVRPGAHMFYWLHYTTANVSSFTEKPLIIWLEGGPGLSSTGYTNFKEIGPFYLNLTSRPHTLIKDYNILFIDSPVGTGFSYADSDNAYPKTNEQVAKDLISFTEEFFKNFPILSNVPTYIVGQSYGGKIAPIFAYEWLKKIESGWNITNLKGIGLSSAWASPVHNVLSMGPYLCENGLINANDTKMIEDCAFKANISSSMKDWRAAALNMLKTLAEIQNCKKNLNFYNIFSEVDHENYSPYDEDEPKVQHLMNTIVKSALKLPETSNFHIDTKPNDEYLYEQTMKPVTKKVEYLLAQPNFKVFVFNGKLDLLVNPKGTFHWVENLTWKNSSKWLEARKKQLIINKSIEGYVKAFENLRMYWVNRAGHLIAVDNPVATRKILKDLTSD